MTAITDIIIKYEVAKATKTNITLTPEEFQAMLGLARLMGPELKLEDMVAAPAVPVPPPAEDENRVMTIDEVCADLRISANTLLKLRRSGQFPEPVKLSERKLGFLRSDLLSWKQARTA